MHPGAGTALLRQRFNELWRRALRATGVPTTRQNGMHVLRHTYASVLLDAGENIKALAAYLGHADPGFTLRIYTHLLPSSEDRTRRRSTRRSGTTRKPMTAWRRPDHGFRPLNDDKGAGQAPCNFHFHLKWTNSRPQFCESFSTR